MGRTSKPKAMKMVEEAMNNVRLELSSEGYLIVKTEKLTNEDLSALKEYLRPAWMNLIDEKKLGK